MGGACGELLAARGAQVVLMARSREALSQLKAAIGTRHRGAIVHCVVGDTGLTTDAERAVAETLAQFGRIDYLLNFAGYSADYPLISPARPGAEQIGNLERIVNIDLLGTARLCFLVEPLLRKQQSGAILTIGNTPTLDGGPEDLLYQVAKAGNRQLTAGIASQHRSDGVRGIGCYFLAPHFVYNPSTYLGMSAEQRRLADRDGWLDSQLHVAPIVLWLLSGRLGIDSGAAVRLDARTAPQLFATVGVAYPQFSPGDS
jgi:3-oxoacyl-[acyl-carrier protein] reductase